MDDHDPGELNPLSFLQAFIVQGIRVAEECTEGEASPANDRVARVGLAASGCLEDVARQRLGFSGTLDAVDYGQLIVEIKNCIGGSFEVASSTSDAPDTVRVLNHRCPFGELVKEAPELCRMTSSVFGAIAARNFGYAKVELRERIATHADTCDVRVYMDPVEAARHLGDEYRCEGETVTSVSASTIVTRRHEERLCSAWRLPSEKGRSRGPPIGIVAESGVMQEALRAVEVVAPTPASVLVTGETGVGKEIIARSVHAFSERSSKIFLAVNCSSIPESLIESALFGHEKGSFTDAYHAREGYFERADGGTLFLDEVDCLTPLAQSQLLRVLQQGEYERVGGTRTRQTDVRIVAASNRSLENLVAEKHFRQDLFYRLNVVPIHLPPLRERPDDLVALVGHFLSQLQEKYRGPCKVLGDRAWAAALRYKWPGNLRELENVLERAYLFATGDVIEDLDVVVPPEATPNVHRLQDYKRQASQEAEARMLVDTLAKTEGNVSAAARHMGITPRAVHMKLRAHGIDASVYRQHRDD